MGTPLLTQGRSVGILAVDDRRAGRGVEAGDGPVLHTVGNLIAGALESSRLYGELEAQNRVLEGRVEERTRDLVRAMSEAQDARTVAEAANAAKSTFLSNVSHELRTPLTSIVGFAKLDRKRLDDVIFPLTPRDDPKVDRAVRQVSETLGIVEAEGLRLKGLIDDLLDLARIESGRFEFRADPVDLRAVVRQAVAATSSLYEVAGLPLEVAVADAVPAVTGDADRLVQVVINLLSNAVKFTRAGSVRCSVATDADEVRVSVADTGSGIPPADHARVFEPFRQSSDTLPDGPKGTGLGLPISRQIVEAHGGRMWLESEPGAGSTFWFAIPVAFRSRPDRPIRGAIRAAQRLNGRPRFAERAATRLDRRRAARATATVGCRSARLEHHEPGQEPEPAEAEHGERLRPTFWRRATSASPSSGGAPSLPSSSSRSG